MLADEPFTDRPRSVCPVIASFLRIYNDRAGDERRQDLYVYAARIVGTRRSAELERRRTQRCLEWLVLREEARPRWRRWLRPSLTLEQLAVLAGDPEAGGHTARMVGLRNTADHQRALAVVDELIALGEDEDLSASRMESASPTRSAGDSAPRGRKESQRST